MPEGEQKSRWDKYKDSNPNIIKLPDLEDAEYLAQLFVEAGIASQAGAGIAPLEWHEIDAWAKLFSQPHVKWVVVDHGMSMPVTSNESVLTVFDKLAIKSMSEAYASELNRASAKDRPAPYVHEDEDLHIDRESVGNKLKSLLRSLKKA